MKKKTVLSILTMTILSTNALMLTSCNDEGNKKFDKNQILKKDWEQNISSNSFRIDSLNRENLAKGELSSLEFQDDKARVYYQSSDNYEFTKKTTQEGTKYYEIKSGSQDSKYFFRDDYSTLTSEITEQKYNSKVNSYVELMAYIKNNFENSTYEEAEIYAYQTTYTRNVYNVNLNNLSSTTYAKDLGVTKILVFRDNFYIKSFGNHNSSIWVYYWIGEKEYRVNFDCSIYYSLINLENFVVKGGPSSKDVDYAENTFTKDGFRIHFPNREDATQRDMYFKGDYDTNNFVIYRQDANGKWTGSKTTESIYTTTRETTLNMYMGFMEYANEFYLTEDGYSITSGLNNKVEPYQYRYYKPLIKVDDNGNVLSGSWKLVIEQGEMKTPEYNIELVVNKDELTYPDGHVTHTYSNEWSKNESYHWHACEDDNCISTKDKQEHDFDDGVIVTEATNANKIGTKKYTCNTCGEELIKEYKYKPKTTIDSEEDWNAAIKFYEKDLDTGVHILKELSSDPKHGTLWSTIYDLYYSNNVIRIAIIDDKSCYDYYSKEGDSYYKYVAEDKVTKTAITEKDYNDVLDEYFNLTNSFKYDDFKNTYNVFEERYELDSYVVDGETVTNVEIYFKNNVLDAIYYTNSENKVVRYHFYFLDSEIDLPTIDE